MTTSGSTNFGFTAREAIDYALKKIRVLDAAESATAEDAEDALRELNVMLKSWQKYESLWRYTEGSITLLDDTVSYELGTAPSVHPYRIISARYRNSSSIDLPMRLLTREEYYSLPQKTNTGTPTQYYVDYQRAAATVYIWQCLGTVTIETIKYTYLRKFEDIDSLDDDIDIRQEHFELVGLNLAARLADDHGRTGPVIDRVIARGMAMLEDALDADREDEIRFIPV